MEFATWAVEWLPIIGEWALAAAAVVLYLSMHRRAPERNVLLIRRLLMIGAVFIFTLALLYTFLQYGVWKEDPFSQNLLPPHQSILYFVKYAGTHFWLAPLLSLIVSITFYGFLRILKHKNERFFEESEVELGAFTALLAGWPRMVVFFPAAFLAVLVIAGIKMARGSGAYTTLGLPFLIGLVASLACGFMILELLGLEFLAVIPGIR